MTGQEIEIKQKVSKNKTPFLVHFVLGVFGLQIHKCP